MDERIEALASLVLFKGLGQSHIERIARIAEDVELKKGQVLFREGEPGDRLFAILEGKVRIGYCNPWI